MPSSGGKGVSSAALSNEYVLKPKEFVGKRSTCDVDNFLWRTENCFRVKGIVDDAGPQIKGNVRLGRGKSSNGTVREYVREFRELILQVSNVTENEALLAFQEGLKLWIRQEVKQRGIQKLSKAMTIVESVVKLGLRKDKLGSSEFEERGVCEGYHKEDKDNGNGNDNNSGNGKPRVGKKKPKRKRDKLKCFLYDCPHMLKKCPRKSAFKKKLVVKALGLGLSARGVEAKEAESEKKSVECFLCHSPHRLRKSPRNFVIKGNDGTDKEPKKLGSSKGKAKAKRAKKNKSVIEGNDGADKEPKKLGSSKGEAKAKRAKRGKKKRVKCFLCHGPHELRNCPKQAIVKGKATSEHTESSEGLPPKEEVSLSSNLKEEVAMKTVKLGPIRLNSSEASELAESSTRLPLMGEVGNASDFKEKEVMHEGQLTRVNAKVHSEHLESVLHSNLLTWQERRGPFEVIEQKGRETIGKEKPSVVNQEDSVRGKLECGQGSNITPYHRDIRTSRIARCHLKVATRALREWVGENVKGQSATPVTIVPNASDRGLLLKWGSFGLRELA
ncbi:hypothetical protein J1N35_001281 [Gossypium stocksii]|uniref:Retrotransposon gag domain-containing protein n=1 Tax=Gossypium stocksii TaxID=47602 RepID=A0A9D4ALW3_9ROSI|nr:hypothetical protein J1N35_001281 [Gossypium stocksii]